MYKGELGVQTHTHTHDNNEEKNAFSSIIWNSKNGDISHISFGHCYYNYIECFPYSIKFIYRFYFIHTTICACVRLMFVKFKAKFSRSTKPVWYAQLYYSAWVWMDEIYVWPYVYTLFTLFCSKYACNYIPSYDSVHHLGVFSIYRASERAKEREN